MQDNGITYLELLAPAKDKECAITAIMAGADAVYIGAEAFGARQKAGNSLKDLKEIADFAHLFGVKVYVTVNTILFDNELKPAIDLIKRLYDIKIDAIIFQDFALLNSEIPPIELHASTQCHNIDIEKIKFFEKCNVKRVVLPREFNLEQIRSVRASTGVEIEAFCHGALCVSYSGQCYLSDYIGKRSANRGECAQPCRKKYSLIDKNGKIYAKNLHLLCLKDLNLENSITELILAGVTSFKVEGRLKDKLYVKNAVLKYSSILDRFTSQNPSFKRQSRGRISANFGTLLSKTFNRDFSEYLLHNNPKSISSFDFSGFKGEFLGKVKEICKNEILLDTKIELNLQDGITFFDGKDFKGTKIIGLNGKRCKVLSSNGLKIGSKIYRNYDAKYLSELEKLELKRVLPLSFKFKFYKNIEITAFSNLSSVTKNIENNFEIANNKNLAIENIKKQFSKLGNTVFEVENIHTEGEKIPHLKLSEWNALRSEIVEELKNKILAQYEPRQRSLDFKPPKFFAQKADYSFNIANKCAKDFVENCGCKVVEFAPEVTNKYGKLMQTKHCLKREFGMCKKPCPKLFLADEFGKKFPLNFDCKNCQMEILPPET